MGGNRPPGGCADADAVLRYCGAAVRCGSAAHIHTLTHTFTHSHTHVSYLRLGRNGEARIRPEGARKNGQHFPLRSGKKCSLETLPREPREKSGSISP